MDLAVLKAVVAYVEVRSGNDNRSAAISQELKQLGARVEPTFTDAVTHVVFKEGMKRTWNKAMKRKVHLVSVSWIDSCKQNQMQVSEKDFTAVLPEEVVSPLPRFNQAVRWKKMKSMQPCDFEEELARSAERGEKRRKRIMMAKRFTLDEEATPTTSPMPVLVFETQARKFPMLNGTDSPVPDTPLSMQERLEKMRREQRQVLGTNLDNSPPATPKAPIDKQLQRRLFDRISSDFVSTESSNDDDDVTSTKIAELIHSLDSNSECGSQASTSSKGLKLLTLGKSPRTSSTMKSPDQQSCCDISQSPLKNHTEKTADINKETSVFSGETVVLRADKRNSMIDSSSLNASTDQGVSTLTVGRSNKIKLSQVSENKSRRSETFRGSLYRKNKRMSSISNALSPKDTNVDDPSLIVKSTETEQSFGKSYPESKHKLIKDFITGDTPCKLGANMEENILDKCDSAKTLKHQNIEDMENETSIIGTELRQRRRVSRLLSNSDVKPWLMSSSGFGSEYISVTSSTCDENVRKTDESSSNVVKKTAAVLDDISQETISTASLKPKIIRKKRTLFTEASLPSLLCSTKTSARQNCSPEASSHKTHSQTLGSNINSDISFMFGASKSFNTKPKEKLIKNKNKKQNTESKKASVVDVSGLETCDMSCSPNVEQISGNSLCKTTLEDISASSGQQNNNSLGDSLLRSDMSMSVMYGNEASVSNIRRTGTSRRSLDDFKISSGTSRRITKLKKISAPALTAVHETEIKSTPCSINQEMEAIKGRKRRTDEIKQPIKQKVKRKKRPLSSISPADKTSAKRSKGSCMSSNFGTDTTLSDQSPSLQDSITPARLRHAHSLLMEQKFQPHLKRSAYSLVVTSLHREEQETVYSIVKKLGVFHMTNNVEATSTHVVCGDPRRTLNVLRAIASGCWLLRKEWVLESLEAGGWLQEESYEMTDFPAAITSRTKRQEIGPAYKVDIFSKLGPIFVSAMCTPPRKEIVHLINLCSGHVTGSETRAAIHIGDDHNLAKLVIKPAWILDCIMKLEALPTDDYIVFPMTATSKRENSPEF